MISVRKFGRTLTYVIRQIHIKLLFSMSHFTTPKKQVIDARQWFDTQSLPADTLEILKKLQSKGYDAYVVGGGVRDLMLKQTPKDYDIVTNARPAAIKKLFRRAFIIGRRFQLVHVIIDDKVTEVTTFRKGVITILPQKRSTHVANNLFGTIEEDVLRRDFTINALYLDIKRQKIIDFLGGMKHLQAKKLCLIGGIKARLLNDPVIMLRAVRFAAKLDFSLEPAFAEALKKYAYLLHQASNERLYGEMIKLLHGGHAEMSWRLLHQHHLLSVLFPSLNLEDAETHELARVILASNDQRHHVQKRRSPAFLFAALLFPALMHHYQKMKQKMSPTAATKKAFDKVMKCQCPVFLIPRMVQDTMYDIWRLQLKLQSKSPKVQKACQEHRRIRAALTLLQARVTVKKKATALEKWWLKQLS